VIGDRESFGTTCNARCLVSDYKQILSWIAQQFGFSCAPGQIDDVEFTGIEPIKAFQRDYNANRSLLGVPQATELPVDGSMGGDTWRAVFDCYEAALAAEVSGAETIEERLQDVAELRKDLQFVDAAKPSAGFGEHHPIERVGTDGLRSQANRRVEILYFNGEQPDLQQSPAQSLIYVGDRFTRRVLNPETSTRVLELRVTRLDGTPIPRAAVTTTIGRQVQTRDADDEGCIIVLVPQATPTILVAWSDPEGVSNRIFKREVFMNLDEPNDANRRRLHNLGYQGPTEESQLDEFRSDFGREDASDDQVRQEAQRWHDGGQRPARADTGLIDLTLAATA
jgi:hypothetical protein